MSRDSEWSGSYPEAEPWPEYEAIQADPCDTPDLLIAKGQSHYATQTYRALERETGDRETFLTATQEYELSEVIQRGLRAEGLLAEHAPMVDDERLALEHDCMEARQARDRLVLANLRLAAYYARASMNILTPQDRGSKERIGTFSDITLLRSATASLEDRTQLANEGLIHAAARFKPRLSEKTGKPTRFSTFAAWNIQQSITRGVTETEHTGVRLTSSVLQELSSAAKDPSSVSPERLAFLALSRQRGTVHTSLEELDTRIIDDESDNDTWDEPRELSIAEVAYNDEQLSDSQIVGDGLLRRDVAKILDELSEREAGIIRMRYGIGYPHAMTLDEIGSRFGVTRETIRTIQSHTMAKLRHPDQASALREYLDDDTMYNLGVVVPGMTEGVVNLSLPYDDVPERGHIALTAEELPERPSNLESWQTESGETWDTPVFLQPEALLEDTVVMAILTDTVQEHFYDTFGVQAGPNDTPTYPAELVSELKDALGRSLAWRHIETWWNEALPRLLDNSDTPVSVNATRLGLFATMLLRESRGDDTQIHLTMPQSLGRLDYFGHGLRFGHVTVNGDLGDYAGTNMDGLGVLEVNGSVGDDAGRGMKSFSTLIVHGDAGYRFGEASETASSICDGTIKVEVVPSLPEAPRPVAVRREIARAALTIGSLQARLRAQEGILDSLYGLGDMASSLQISRVSERIDSLHHDLKRERDRQYWRALRSATVRKERA